MRRRLALLIPLLAGGCANGAVTIENGRHTGARAHRVLYGPGKK